MIVVKQCIPFESIAIYCAYSTQMDSPLFLCRSHHRIALIEEAGSQLLFLRPRRFGKSPWLSTLENDYDLARRMISTAVWRAEDRPEPDAAAQPLLHPQVEFFMVIRRTITPLFICSPRFSVEQ